MKQLASTEPNIAQAAVHMVVVIHIGDSNSNRLRHLSTPYIGESLADHGYHLQKHCAMIALIDIAAQNKGVIL